MNVDERFIRVALQMADVLLDKGEPEKASVQARQAFEIMCREMSYKGDVGLHPEWEHYQAILGRINVLSSRQNALKDLLGLTGTLLVSWDDPEVDTDMFLNRFAAMRDSLQRAVTVLSVTKES